MTNKVISMNYKCSLQTTSNYQLSAGGNFVKNVEKTFHVGEFFTKKAIQCTAKMRKITPMRKCPCLLYVLLQPE